jgi:hypothetical protein
MSRAEVVKAEAVEALLARQTVAGLRMVRVEAEQAVTAVWPVIERAVRAELGARLRHEAERARTSPFGSHPDVSVLTHAAALRYAARIVEGP